MHSSRRTLPTRRKSQTWKVKIDGRSVFLTYSLYEDGSLAEIFIDVPRYGSAIQTWMQESAMMFSVALQYGTPLQTLINLFVNTKSDPCGKVVGHPDIVSCTSIMDFVVRCLSLEFNRGEKQEVDKGGDGRVEGDGTGRELCNGDSSVSQEITKVSVL